jgi:hypothetical protein
MANIAPNSTGETSTNPVTLNTKSQARFKPQAQRLREINAP